MRMLDHPGSLPMSTIKPIVIVETDSEDTYFERHQSLHHVQVVEIEMTYVATYM